MAKKRLNKKVALIGSAIFVVFVIMLIAAVLYLSQDPEKFMKDGDIAVQAADEATDELVKEEEYRKAISSYNKARSQAKVDSLKIETISRLADVHTKTDEWNYVLGSWNGIIQIDPRHAETRYRRLKYFYIMASNGAQGYWRDIEQQASEFLEFTDAELLAEDIAQWQFFGMPQEPIAKRLGPYLYLVRGRANLEMVRMAVVTDRDESLARAISDLEKTCELEPENVNAQWFLAQSIITKGGIAASRGELEQRSKTAVQASELLEKAIEFAPDNPKAYINLLWAKLIIAQFGDREEVRALESECLALVEKFSSSAEVYSVLAGFYLNPFLGHKYLDKGIGAIEKAVELDRENVTYALGLANAYYRKYSIYQQAQWVQKAIETAEQALTLPDVQRGGGPQQWANRTNRAALYSVLANCYIEQMLNARHADTLTETQQQQWTAGAQQAVYEIEQIYASGEDPQVVKWQGMLQLAQGDDDIAAVRKMYTAYEQIKASGQRDALLSYRLAKVFEGTSEIGAAIEFFASALRSPQRAGDNEISQSKPEALLDYASILLKLRFYSSALSQLGPLERFESEYWLNDRSRTLRTRALIGTGQLDEVEQLLTEVEPDDPNTIRLKLDLLQARVKRVQVIDVQKQAKPMEELFKVEGITAEPGTEPDKAALEISSQQPAEESLTEELRSYRDAFAELVERLLAIEPAFVTQSYLIDSCKHYIMSAKIEQAVKIINRFLEHYPEDTIALFYQRLLTEPDPSSVDQQKLREIQEGVLLNVADPILRAVSLGTFYQRYGEPNEAIVEYKKILNLSDEPSDNITLEDLDDPRMANAKATVANAAFIIAIRKENWGLAEKITDIARREDLDSCAGKFYDARLEMAKQQYQNALISIEECLRQRPVFSHAYMIRSSINARLHNEHTAMEDAQKAAYLNPRNSEITRALALLIYQRNKKLGQNVTSAQIVEAKFALRTALSLNKGDAKMELVNVYADSISQTEPFEALAVRQNMQKLMPSVENALLLADMAIKIASRREYTKRKEALYAMAGSAYEDAIKLVEVEPQNKKNVLNAYAEYCRITGQEQKAEELLAQSQDKRLLWSYYMRAGRFDDAKRVVQQMYKVNSNDTVALKGLILVAEREVDTTAAEKYSDELLLLEDTVENHLLQIQTFLRIGLIQEAKLKLESIKEKYPDETRTLLLEALLATRQGELVRALDLANQALQTSQDNAMAWRLRGEINGLMANYDQAIIDLKTSNSLVDSPATHFVLARAYLRAERREDAVTELKNMMDMPQAPPESMMLLEQVYRQLGQRDALIKFYDQVLEKLPNSVLWHNRAATFAGSQGYFDKAQKLYELAWQKSNDIGNPDSESLNGYLQTFLAAGKFNELFEQAQKHIDGQFASVAFIAMAQARIKLGDNITAREYGRKALEKAFVTDDENLASWVLQQVYLLLGADEIISYCQEQLKAEPDSLAANYTMYGISKINREYNKAVDYIDKCLKIAGPDSPKNVNYTVQKAAVLQLAYDRSYDKSYLMRIINEYESLLAKMPNNENILNNLAYVLAEQDIRLDDALKYAERVHQIRPNNPGYLDTYAYVLYRNGSFKEAAQFFRASKQQYETLGNPVPAEIYEHLGMVNEQLQDRVQALDAYKQALEAGADTLPEAAKERINKAIERLSQ